MIEILQIGQGTLERALIFSFVVAGVYLASRLIRFDNLATEGAFGVGGAVAVSLLTKQFNPWIALISGAAAGGLVGVIMGFLITKLHINHLISGIIATTGLFSIALKIAGSNVILRGPTIFTHLPIGLLPIAYQKPILLTILCLAVFVLIQWFLTTEVGFLLRAVGEVPQMLTNVGKSVDWYITLGLILSNMLAALAGALFVFYTGYFSIWSNFGVLIIGLSGMLLADLFSNRFGLILVLGSILYQSLIAITFELQIDQDWNKLVTACLMVMLLVVKRWLMKQRGPYASA
jgi:putative ABC transport system permease protein